MRSRGAPRLWSRAFRAPPRIGFASSLREEFATRPIVLTPDDPETLARAVEMALRDLPGGVADGARANATFDDVFAGNANDARGGNLTIDVRFAGVATEGALPLLRVEARSCGAGCAPRVAGVDLVAFTGSDAYDSGGERDVGAGGAMLSYVTEMSPPTLRAYECGRRGKCDYGTGLCACFQGYSGERCELQAELM